MEKDFSTLIEEIRLRPQIYKTLTVDLANARSNEEIIITGNYLIMYEATDYSTNIDVRFNETSADAINITKSRGMKIPFYRLYLSNAAQPGKTVSFIFGVADNPVEFLQEVVVTVSGEIAIAENVIEQATGPVIYNVPCVIAATEYSQALPANARKFTVKARGGDLQLCFIATESGSNYFTLADGQAISEDLLKLTGKTLFFRSSLAGTVAEILTWT